MYYTVTKVSPPKSLLSLWFDNFAQTHQSPLLVLVALSLLSQKHLPPSSVCEAGHMYYSSRQCLQIQKDKRQRLTAPVGDGCMTATLCNPRQVARYWRCCASTCSSHNFSYNTMPALTLVTTFSTIAPGPVYLGKVCATFHMYSCWAKLPGSGYHVPELALVPTFFF